MLSVLIVGCGLSGLASALALAQAGHRVTVFERSAKLQEVTSCFLQNTL
jgi:salicylate hydroxylase